MNKDSDNFVIFQSNQLVRYIRHDMSLQQRQIYNFLASLIRKEDEPDTVYSFTAQYMLQELRMTSGGKNYGDLKAILKYLRDHSQWIRNERGNLEAISILDYAEFEEENAIFKIRFHRLIQPHLFNLVERFTAIPLELVKVFKCKYALELNEFLLSFFNEKGQQDIDLEFSLQEIKERINSDYERWVDIKRFALDPSIQEINTYSTSMRITYTPVKDGKRITRVIFHITKPTDAQAFQSIKKIGKKKREGKPKTRKRISKTRDTRVKPDMEGLPV